MVPKKRVATEEPSPKTFKKGRKQGTFESQDVWKNLDRIRTQDSKAGDVISNSYVFIPIFGNPSDYEPCIAALHEYVAFDKLQLKICDDCVVPAYVSLRDFSPMDFCLVMSILFSFKNKRWIFSNNNSHDLFTIPKGLNISGTFYLPSSCASFDANNPQLKESEFQTHYNFKEYHLNATSLSQIIHNLWLFVSGIKFSKSSKLISNYFSRALNQIYQTMDLGVKEIPFLNEGLYSPTNLTNINLPLIEQSKSNLQKYGEELIKYNSMVEQAPSSAGSLNKREKQSTPMHNTSRQGTPNRNNSNNPAPVTQGTRPNFMTQDQIRQHCIATIKASQEIVKTKSVYQILKTYVKCPRQNYIDRVYQNLNELRSQTNCNIVVLNLNNLHESRPWFDSLNVSKFTAHAQQPHPSTVRVVSIGGIGEHVQKALELIYSILLQE